LQYLYVRVCIFHSTIWCSDGYIIFFEADSQLTIFLVIDDLIDHGNCPFRLWLITDSFVNYPKCWISENTLCVYLRNLYAWFFCRNTMQH